MRDRTRRGVLAAGLAVAVACGGSACAVVPTSGNPVSFQEVVKGDPLRKPYVRVIAVPPRPEWTPQQVVNGFRAAMAGFDKGDWKIAKEYLTEEAAHNWRPDAGVTVYDVGEVKGATPESDATEAKVTLKATVTARIDQEGRYRVARTPIEQPFTLHKIPGKGWRIAGVPDGLLLSESDIRRSYRDVKLYFLDRTMESLVVDEVRVPIDPDSDFAETIVRRLLDGPTSALKGAVRTAIPEGTELNRITTEDDRVIVDLTAAAGNAITPGYDQVKVMSAQLGWTLHQLTEGWTIEVRINDEPFYSSGTLRIPPERYTKFDRWLTPGDMPAYFVKDGALLLLRGEKEGLPVPGKAGEPNPGFTGHAIAGADRVAARSTTQGGIWVAPLTQDGEWHQWITGGDLTDPSWDRHGGLWAVERVGPATSQVLRHDGNHQIRVAAPDLDATRVDDLRVARDGVRVAVTLRDEEGLHVRVGTIVDDAERTRITNLQTLMDAEDGQEILDMAWQDATTLLVLTGGKPGHRLTRFSVTDGTFESANVDARIQTISALDEGVFAGAVDDGESALWRWDPAKAEWRTLIKNDAGFPATPLG